MANVRGERGQLLLVAALAMAVMFVSLALALNTAIYTENLATRSSDIAGGSDALEYTWAATDGVEGLLEQTNSHHNASYVTLSDNMTTGIDRWVYGSSHHRSLVGEAIEITNIALTNGSRIVQTNGSRNFTAADGTHNWPLSDTTNRTRRFRVNVSRESLPDVGQLTVESDLVNTYQIYITDTTTTTWRVHLYRNLTGTDTVNATVEHPSGSFSTPCSVTGDHVVVDLVAGTIGDESCPVLKVNDTLSTLDAIYFNETISATNESTVNGTYDIIVASTDPASSPAPYLNDGPNDGSPWVASALYSVTFDAISESTQLRYNTTVRVAPGENDG